MFGITSWTDTQGDACPPFSNLPFFNSKTVLWLTFEKMIFYWLDQCTELYWFWRAWIWPRCALIITIITHTRLLSHWGRKHCCQFTSVKYGHETQFHNEITSWFIRIRQNWLRGTLTVIFWPPWYSQNYCYNSIKERRRERKNKFFLCPRSNHKCHSFFRLLRLGDMRGDIFP